MESLNTIVLAGDYNYIRQIETLLKSISHHHSSLKIYVFNQDIPPEWFRGMRAKLSPLHIQLVNIKLLDSRLDIQWTASFPHINYMAYARYFIPLFVKEDTVLYLDSDIIVTGNLDSLFQTDLKDYYGAAVKALHGMTNIFNSGVILVNNRKWERG